MKQNINILNLHIKTTAKAAQTMSHLPEIFKLLIFRKACLVI